VRLLNHEQAGSNQGQKAIVRNRDCLSPIACVVTLPDKCYFGGDFTECVHASAIRPRWTLHYALSHQLLINQESHLRFAIIIFSEDVPSHEVSHQLIS
jgi:hypothetical protein